MVSGFDSLHTLHLLWKDNATFHLAVLVRGLPKMPSGLLIPDQYRRRHVEWSVLDGSVEKEFPRSQLSPRFAHNGVNSCMPHDKQLCGVSLDAVVEKRRLDQALNAKEFAVLAGISYSTARAWFRLPGFPVFRGVVFWQDFVQWRTAQTGLNNLNAERSHEVAQAEVHAATRSALNLPARAARVLQEAG